MRVLVVGAHGRIGYRLVERLAPSRHEVRAMVRDPDQQPALAAAGATETVVADLERGCREAVRGVEGVVLTAGGSAGQADAVDRDGAQRLIAQAEAAGVKRFLLVSAMRAKCPEEAPEGLRAYLAAKRETDERLRRTDMAWTIVRPGELHDGRATGRIALGANLPYGSIARDDIAALLASLLTAEASQGQILEAVAGETAIREAVRRLA